MDSRALISLAGVALSIYALYVENKLNADPEYVALCDLHERVSCSDVFHSDQGRGFGLLKYLVGEEHVINAPISAYGVVFYGFVALLSSSSSVSRALPWSRGWTEKVVFAACVVACVGSVWLIYVLVFVLVDFCVLCFATHVINFSLIYLTRVQMKAVERSKKA